MQMGNYLACGAEKMHSQPLIYINYNNQLKRAVGVRQRAFCAPSSIRQNVHEQDKAVKSHLHTLTTSL